MLWWTLLWGLVWGLAGVAWAGELSEPPPLFDEPVEERRFLREVYNQHNNLVVVTSTPNGSRNGRVGDMLLYNNAGSWKACYNIDGSTTWRCDASALTAP